MERRHNTNHAIVRDEVAGIMLWEGMKEWFSILDCCDFQEWDGSSRPGRNGSSLQPDASFPSAASHYFWKWGGGQHSSWDRLTAMPVSFLWVKALDQKHSQLEKKKKKLFRNKSMAQGSQSVGANLLEFAPNSCLCVSCWSTKSFLSDFPLFLPSFGLSVVSALW